MSEPTSPVSTVADARLTEVARPSPHALALPPCRGTAVPVLAEKPTTGNNGIEREQRRLPRTRPRDMVA